MNMKSVNVNTEALTNTKQLITRTPKFDLDLLRREIF